MGQQTIRSDRFKLGLSIFWFLFTLSMVIWWWIFSLRQLKSVSADLAPEKFESLHRMLLWEGAFLLLLILVGGSSLLFLTNQERKRNLRLRLFFSNFSHDLKTSLSRLRLRAEVLANREQNPQIQKLMDEVSRLDLQLENSLWVGRGEEQQLLTQKVLLSDLIGFLRVEWPEIEVHLQKNAELLADQQALKSIFRNLFQNASLHGQATRIDLKVDSEKPGKVRILVCDNGKGFSGDTQNLGKKILPATEKEGNGLGLYLTKHLLQRMKGDMEFGHCRTGFEAVLKIPGEIKS